MKTIRMRTTPRLSPPGCGSRNRQVSERSRRHNARVPQGVVGAALKDVAGTCPGLANGPRVGSPGVAEIQPAGPSKAVEAVVHQSRAGAEREHVKVPGRA